MTLLAGRYRLLSQLGQGGMGTVWLASDELLRQEVAIKEVRFPPDLDAASRGELAERTLREARAAARLRSHPAIVTVHDVVLDGGRPWIVMELVRGRSLDRAVRDGGPLPPRQVAMIGLRVLDALSAAHASGILHRDVKPANVMLTDDGRVLLTDFGIATVAGDVVLTQTGLLSGSPGYIAPERLRGEVDGPLADLWSLGATLFTAVEGTAPFARENPAAAMAAVLMQQPAAARLAGPLAPVLAVLLEKDPVRRCPPERAAQLLNAVAQGASTTDLGRRRTLTGSRRWSRRILPGAVLAVVLAVAAGVVIVVQVLPKTTTATSGTPAPPVSSSRPTTPAPALFTREFDACDLLTAAQVRSLFGRSMKRTFVNATVCTWSRPDGTYVSLSASRYEQLEMARIAQRNAVKSMKEEPRRTPGTKLRNGPDVGDEAYSYTQYSRIGGLLLHRRHISVRIANVWLVLDHNGRQPGYAVADKAAELVAAAIDKYR
ncbi:serine/threonine-protein kinase [Nonomuraea sediminis]|uniref:serine/threonine-protein kinase n=1 Tax=Nonomuraea sediminis TaxID=2835864 RepID=UPI0027E02F50|nr:protein kinase [Nonomuraea sediminis]